MTDPPYGIKWHRGPNVGRRSKPQPGIIGDQDTSARDTILAQWLPRPAVVFGSDLAPKPGGVRHTLYWNKPPDAGVYGSTTGFRRDVELIFLCGELPRRKAQWSSVLRSASASVGGSAGPAGRYGHPHAKPVDLMIRLLEIVDGNVIDPFMGSGSTLVAAKHLRRRAIGIEMDEQYCERAVRRLSQDTLGLVG